MDNKFSAGGSNNFICRHKFPINSVILVGFLSKGRSANSSGFREIITAAMKAKLEKKSKKCEKNNEKEKDLF